MCFRRAKRNRIGSSEKKMDDRDVLICRLCNKQLNDPRHLICLHTFCKGCIKTNASRVLKGKSDGYPCPLCQRKTPISGENWIDELPVNDLLLDLIDAQRIRNGDVTCAPCSRKGKSTEAAEWCSACREALCQECAEVHGTLKDTMKHDSYKLAQLLKLPLSNIVSTPFCPDHDGEKLTMYCDDHGKMICTSCAANGHRSCKSVSKIEDVSKKKQGGFRKLKGSLEKQAINAGVIRDDRQEALSLFDNTNLTTRSKIESVRKRMNDLLLRCEKKALDELDVVYEREKTDYDRQITEAESLYEESSHALNLAERTTKDGNGFHLLEWLGKLEDEESRIADDLGKMERKAEKRTLDFKISRQLEDMMKSVNTLGELLLSKEGRERKFIKKTPSKSAVTVRKATQAPAPRLADQVINVRTFSEEEPCWITGLAALTSGSWIMADRNNSKVKVFDNNLKLKSECSTENAPFDVTLLDESQVGVTIPDACVIQLYDIKTGINAVKSVPVKGQCYGVSFADDKFVVTCPVSAPPTVKIITLDGKELSNISPRDNFIPLLLRPWYVKFDPNGSNFYVSDANKNHVSCLNRSVLRHYKYVDFSMTGPRGITLGENGDLYVCGWGSDNIHKIDASGKFAEEVLTRHNGVISPQCVCLSADRKHLAVSLDPTSGNSDEVQMFRL